MSQPQVSSQTLTDTLIDSVRGLRYDDLPEPVRRVGRHCLLDLLGVTLAGTREPLVDTVYDCAVASDRAQEATLIGRRERASALNAALLNGTAGHALDYDDTHMALSGHPTVPVLPALLALAETSSATAAECLAALIAGIELECRLGLLLGPSHYDRGFHATATLGTFGAAGACAHLLALSEDKWRHALGLAGTQAAGLKSGFGTMAKPLHAGRAACTGLFSALLAQGGFTGHPAILDTAQGFADTHSDDLKIERLSRYQERFLTLDTLFKYHAACYLTHAPIEASNQIRVEHAVDPLAIEAVTVRVNPGLLKVCNIEAPTTGLEGKFSLRSTTAMALLGLDTSDRDLFNDATVREPALVALRDRVRVETDPELSTTQAQVRVATERRTLEASADSGVAATDLEAQEHKLLQKFRALVGPLLGDERARELGRQIVDLEPSVPIRDLMGAITPP